MLYEAAAEGEKRTFPKRILFSGIFDTGTQGRHWPGEFEIVNHEKPLTWKAAKSVVGKDGSPRLVVGLRGPRRLDERTELTFRYKFTGAGFILMFFVAGLTLPLKLAIIPLFILLRDLGILNTHAALIVVYVATGLPTTVFIMTGFIRTLPSELEDAARMDGASEALIMWKIMLPLVRPALVIAGIQNVVPIWNDFFFPLVFIQSDRLKTLPQGLASFMGEYNTDWGVMFSGLTLSVLPIVVIYIVLSKQFINGMTSGAVK